MRLRVSLSPGCGPDVTADETAVIIDVLRATSVMATALENGATEFVTFKDVDRAREFGAEASVPIGLCGERQCVRIDGFDFGNSPAEYMPETVAGKTLVLTTTNGTAAIAKATSAKEMIIASFLNLAAVLETLSNESAVHLVCAGTNGRISSEDVLLAGAITHQLALCQNLQCEGDEAGIAAALWRNRYVGSLDSNLDTDDDCSLLTRLLSESQGGRNLIKVGYQSDIGLCAAANSIHAVPRRVAGTENRFRLVN